MSQAHSIFTNPDPQFWDRKKLYVYQNQYIRIKLWGDALYVYCVDGKLQAIDEMFIYRYQWVEYMERLALGTAKVRDRRQLACFVYTMQTKGWKKVSTIYSYLEKQSSVAITTSFTKLLLTTQLYKSQSFKKILRSTICDIYLLVKCSLIMQIFRTEFTKRILWKNKTKRCHLCLCFRSLMLTLKICIKI